MNNHTHNFEFNGMTDNQGRQVKDCTYDDCYAIAPLDHDRDELLNAIETKERERVEAMTTLELKELMINWFTDSFINTEDRELMIKYYIRDYMRFKSNNL